MTNCEDDDDGASAGNEIEDLAASTADEERADNDDDLKKEKKKAAATAANQDDKEEDNIGETTAATATDEEDDMAKAKAAAATRGEQQVAAAAVGEDADRTAKAAAMRGEQQTSVAAAGAACTVDEDADRMAKAKAASMQPGGGGGGGRGGGGDAAETLILAMTSDDDDGAAAAAMEDGRARGVSNVSDDSDDVPPPPRQLARYPPPPVIPSQPGAFYADTGRPAGYDDSSSDDEEDEETRAALLAATGVPADGGHVGHVDPVATAYTVDETEPTMASATAIKTFFGHERKYFYVLIGGVVILAIVLGSVLGTVLPGDDDGNGSPAPPPPPPAPDVCGPLCPTGVNVPDETKEVLGFTCQDWNFNSTVLPRNNISCTERYLPAAYGCDCPEVQIPTDACGMLCRAEDGSIYDPQDGQGNSTLPEPDLIVTDIHGQTLSCADWELLSRFDTVSPVENQCVNYNAIGSMCGCEHNVPHPDACGPICGPNSTVPIPQRVVWGLTCGDWYTLSTFLPDWYNNEAGESCVDYYYDVAFECLCPDLDVPPVRCDTLCQERSECGLLCQDGSDVPDPDLVVRDETCRGWEFWSRVAPSQENCYFYDMIGAECGCSNNVPPDDACGPLCGASASLPDPEKEVQGQTCGEWNGLATYLFEGYGDVLGGTSIPSCDAVFARVAFGCDCPDVAPPPDACGTLCDDGSAIPDPDLVVGDRTCGDFELLSQFEMDSETCSRYKEFVAIECGCPHETANATDCFTLEDLYGQLFFKTIGLSQYTISLGEGGEFNQIQNNNARNLIGRFNGFGTGSKWNRASYGGGGPCGQHGPRRGSAVVVEDPSVTEPILRSVVEPYICTYHAEISVPKICNHTANSTNYTIQAP